MKLAKRLFSPKKDPPPAAAAAPAAAPAPPACPPQLSPANLIVALDHVLASEGDEEWCERLAVLTTSALFLLDRSGGRRDPKHHSDNLTRTGYRTEDEVVHGGLGRGVCGGG